MLGIYCSFWRGIHKVSMDSDWARLVPWRYIFSTPAQWKMRFLKTIVDFCFDIFHLIFTQGRAINSPNANWFLRWNWKVTLADVCIISHFYTHNYYQWSCYSRTNLFVNYYFTNLFGSGIRNKNKAGVSSWKITLCFTSYKEEDEACHVLVSL